MRVAFSNSHASAPIVFLKGCFDETECTGITKSQCGNVNDCNNFFNPGTEDTIVEKQCSKEMLEVDPAPCQKICESHKCTSFSLNRFRVRADKNLICASFRRF